MKFSIRDLLLVTLIAALTMGLACVLLSYKHHFPRSESGLPLPNSLAPAPNPPKP